MGIDIKAGGRVKTKQRKAKTTNPYLKLLIKLYKFMARRTDSKFNKVVLKRLNFARRNKAPMSLSKLASLMEKKDGKTAAVVSPVTDDKRLTEVPKLSVCALRFTEAARARITKNGGECLTFDQLALRSPLGKGIVLLRAATKSREAEKYFGKAPGVPGSNTKQRVRHKGRYTGNRTRKFEMARGQRKSRGFKT